MSKIKYLATSFNAGELSPQLYGRSDLKQYQNGCAKLTNCVVKPQGGVAKRVGTKYVSAITNISGYYRTESFVFNQNESYIVLFTTTKIIVIDANSYKTVATLNQNVYSEAHLRDINVIQEQDTMLVTCTDKPVHRVIRDRRSGSTMWRFEPIGLSNIPYYDFVSGRPTGDPRTTIQQVDYTVTANTTFKINLYGVNTNTVAINLNDSTQTVANRIDTALEALSVPNHPRITVKTTVKTSGTNTGTITFEFIDASFGVWDLVSFTDVTGEPTLLTATMVQEGRVEGEPVWSEKRGYPISAVTHGGRLWFAGTKSRPQTLWASRSGSFYDFGVVNPDELLANDALDITLADTKSNLITCLYSSTNLLIFTVGGLFSVKGDSDGLVTPMTVNASKESELGSRKVQPVSLDNSVMFLQSTGAQLNATTYDYSSNGFVTASQAMLSDHLIRNPDQLAVVHAGDDYNSNYLFVRNGDGTLALFNRLLEQDTQSWTPFLFPHKVTSIASVFSKLFLTWQVGTTVYLEEFNGDNKVYSDSFTSISKSAPVDKLSLTDHSQLARFRGKPLTALLDGYPVVDLKVDGQYITLPFKASTIIIGLEYPCKIKTLPFAVQLQSGSTRYGKKRVTSAKFDMDESIGFEVKYGRRTYSIADFKTDFMFNEPPKPIGDIRSVKFLGYTEDAQIEIDSRDPMPLSLRSLQLTVQLVG